MNPLPKEVAHYLEQMLFIERTFLARHLALDKKRRRSWNNPLVNRHRRSIKALLMAKHRFDTPQGRNQFLDIVQRHEYLKNH